MYNGAWNTVELNQNDFDEPGEIKFFIENWLFQTHPITRVPRWFPRHEFRGSSQRERFTILQSDYDIGQFSFKQTTKLTVKMKFDISIIVVRKETQSLNITYTSSLLSFMPDGFFSFSAKSAIKELCHMWTAKTNEIVKPDDLGSCPCTLESAKMNPNLHVDFTCSSIQPDCHENLNAHRCFLKRIKYVYLFYFACVDHRVQQFYSYHNVSRR